MPEELTERLSDAEIKVATGKQKKDVGDQAFKAGELKDALRAYYEALLYLSGIDKNAMKAMGGEQSQAPTDSSGKERTEVDEIIEKIYSNMSACHIKLQNWRRAEETANKALSKNENNYKAMYRKAKALGEQGFFEKAEKVFEELIKKNPEEAPGYKAELERLRAIDKEREKAYRQKQKGFLARGFESEKSSGSPSTSTDAPASTPSTSAA